MHPQGNGARACGTFWGFAEQNCQKVKVESVAAEQSCRRWCVEWSRSVEHDGADQRDFWGHKQQVGMAA